jgi:hypothetical protein
MALKSPKGTIIVGTLEALTARHEFAPDTQITRTADGKFDFEHVDRAEVFWEGQMTVERDGQRIFLDEHGEEFKESELVLE